jgi:hypothetical protein
MGGWCLTCSVKNTTRWDLVPELLISSLDGFSNSDGTVVLELEEDDSTGLNIGVDAADLKDSLERVDVPEVAAVVPEPISACGSSALKGSISHLHLDQHDYMAQYLKNSPRIEL